MYQLWISQDMNIFISLFIPRFLLQARILIIFFNMPTYWFEFEHHESKWSFRVACHEKSFARKQNSRSYVITLHKKMLFFSSSSILVFISTFSATRFVFSSVICLKNSAFLASISSFSASNSEIRIDFGLHL